MSAGKPLPPVHQDMSADGPVTPAEWDNLQPEPDRRARTYYDDLIRLPGFGEQPDRCMHRKPVGFCTHSGHVTLASASPCETRRCPEHWRMWQRKAATSLTARLAAYRYVQSGRGKRLIHVVDAPDPRQRWTAEAFWEGRGGSYDTLKDRGCRGGVCIPHPYRTSDEGDWHFKQATERGNWDRERGRWSFLRDMADDWEELGRYIEGGPHYHHITAAEDFNVDDLPRGRVVKNIRSLERFELADMTGYRDMARVAMYLLSHAAYEPHSGRNTVTYWGDVHPNAFNPEEELTVSEWDQIQRRAERAVTTRPSDDLGESGASEPDRDSCRVDGCDGEIVPIWDLRDWLDDNSFRSRLGRRERQILRGVVVWLEEGGDRPPPSNREAMIYDWLQQLGRKREFSNQSSLGGYVQLYPAT